MSRIRSAAEATPAIMVDTIEQFGVNMAYDDAGDVDTVRNGLCAASIFIEDLTPYVKKTAVSDRRRSKTLDIMSKVIESGSPSDVLNRMDELLDAFAETHEFFPPSLFFYKAKLHF